ncbi:MAG: hypothetical protein P8J44_07005, partial [Gammaproteobacteria bacterium]|nr:hypothetical protein [Gammaproteobacteria bacterium]
SNTNSKQGQQDYYKYGTRHSGLSLNFYWLSLLFVLVILVISWGIKNRALYHNAEHKQRDLGGN